MFALTVAQGGYGMIHDLNSKPVCTTRFVEDSGAHLVVKEMDLLRDANSNSQSRRSHRKNACHGMRRVREPLGDPKDFLPCCFADSRTSVQSAIHSPNRDLGQFSDLVDARSLHSLLRNHIELCFSQVNRVSADHDLKCAGFNDALHLAVQK